MVGHLVGVPVPRLQVAVEHRPHPEPQRHQPAVRRRPEPVRDARIPCEIGIHPKQVAELQPSPESNSPGEQLEQRIAPSQGEHPRRRLYPRLHEVRPRPNVAEGSQRSDLSLGIADPLGHGGRLLRDACAILGRCRVDPDHRQAGEDCGPERAVPDGQEPQGVLKEFGLLDVEHVHLETTEAAAHGQHCMRELLAVRRVPGLPRDDAEGVPPGADLTR